MFQYAFFHYQLQTGETVWLDYSAPFIRRHGQIELERAFKAAAQTPHKLPYWKARPFYLAGDILKKVFKKNLQTDQEHPAQKAIWWKGYWQEYRYPEAVKDTLLHDFQFAPPTDDMNKKTLAAIESSNSISIHVRRDDYENPHIRTSVGDICTPDYYREAITYIRTKITDPVFYIFSDNQRWARRHLQIPEAVYVTGNTGLNSYRDLQLMSRCKHQIIANSTFSWWGAWLNQSSEKTVLTPAKWGHNQFKNFADKLLPPTWRRIGRTNPNISLIINKATEQDILMLLRQRYDDFELLTDIASDISDQRLKSITQKPTGNHIFTISKKELPKFVDQDYLQKKLTNHFSASRD